jgi:short-subunit dehydrogenase
MEKVILITGCSKNTGIGYNAALSLAGQNHKVIATIRNKNNIENLNELHQREPTFSYLDLSNEESIQTCVLNIINQYGRIDTLVNNAGYGLIGSIEQLDLSQIRQALEVNIIGTISLIQHVIPHMKDQSSGHIINVSSIHSTRYCQPARMCYRGSKAFIETASEALSFELAQWGINVSLFEPGRLTSSITKEHGNIEIDNESYDKLNKKSMHWFKQNTPPPQDGSEVAKYLVELINMENPPFHYQTGNSTREYAEKWRGLGKSERQHIELKSFYEQ